MPNGYQKSCRLPASRAISRGARMVLQEMGALHILVHTFNISLCY